MFRLRGKVNGPDRSKRISLRKVRRVREAIKRRDMIALAEHRRLLQRSPRLHYLFFELTDSCNMRCLHCGSSCGEGQVRFLSEDKVKEVLECTAKAYQAERIMVCFTGGEPMLHPRFF